MTPPRPRPLWIRLLRIAALGLGVVSILLSLGVGVLVFEGRRDWERTKKDLLARGEKLTLVEFAAPKLPPGENFFDDPLWTELTERIEITAEDGTRRKEPRLKTGERQIDALNPRLSPELLVRARTLLPKESWPKTTKSLDASSAAQRALKKTVDPARRHELAQFVLDVLASSGPVRAHIEQLLKRPTSVYPADYAEGFNVRIDPIVEILHAGQVYNHLALAHLTLGQTAEAARDLDVLLRLNLALRQEPLFVSLLVRVVLIFTALATIDNGVSLHLWTDAQLAGFDHSLAQIDLLPHLTLAYRGERGGGDQLLEGLDGPDSKEIVRNIFNPLSDISPDCYLLPALTPILPIIAAADQGSYNRHLQLYIDAFASSPALDPPKFAIPKPGTPLDRLRHPLITANGSVFDRVSLKAIYYQDAVLQTRMACVLERYRFVNKTYPETLAALVPNFLPGIPADVIAGQTFFYRRDASDRFQLWSAGWNQTDEGGQPSATRLDYRTADWVWMQEPGTKP